MAGGQAGQAFVTAVETCGSTVTKSGQIQELLTPGDYRLEPLATTAASCRVARPGSACAAHARRGDSRDPHARGALAVAIAAYCLQLGAEQRAEARRPLLEEGALALGGSAVAIVVMSLVSPHRLERRSPHAAPARRSSSAAPKHAALKRRSSRAAPQARRSCAARPC